MPRINASGEDKIIYNFPYSSKVYLYDRQTQETLVMDMPSQTVPNELDMKEFDLSSWAETGLKEMATSRFSWVYYSAEADKYYRVHYSEDEEENRKRKTYLMVYDEKKRTTKEYLLPTEFSEIYFIHDDVLYFDFDGTNDTQNKPRCFHGIIRGLSDIGNLMVEDLTTGQLREFGFKEIGYIL